MLRLFLAAALSATAGSAWALEPYYPRDPGTWLEVPVPPASSEAARERWEVAANRSRVEWRVLTEGGAPTALLDDDAAAKKRRRPGIVPHVGQFRRFSAFLEVDDGWLIAFNHGEFGAALYWFDREGRANYRISDHQVADFFRLSNGVHAIEGLDHLGRSAGSLIRISRAPGGARWEATTAVKLPAAPSAVSVRRNGTMLITLSGSLVVVDRSYHVRTLLAEAPWETLYPGSSALSADERKLYIGMRQYVGEFDLASHRLRMLVPDRSFLNRLSAEDEARIRRTHGR